LGGRAAALTFSPDGKLLAAGGGDCKIRIWHTGTGKVLRTLNCPSAFSRRFGVTSVAFSPDGNLLAAATTAATVWDLTTGEAIGTFGQVKRWDHHYCVESVCFSPDGRLLALATRAHTVELWDVASGKRRRAMKGHKTTVDAVAFCPDGRFLASSSDDGVRIWNPETGKQLRHLRGHRYGVNSAAFSPDSSLLATVSNDDTAKLWNVRTGAELRTLKGKAQDIGSAAFSPDGEMLVVGGYWAELWDVPTGTKLWTIPKAGTIVSFSPKGNLFASVHMDWGVVLWGQSTRMAPVNLGSHPPVINSVAISPDNRLLASASLDRTIKVWDMATAKQHRVLRGRSPVTRLAFRSDGKTLAACDLSTVTLWDAALGKKLRTLTGSGPRPGPASFSPDGRTIAASRTKGEGTQFRLWDVVNGKELETWEGKQAGVVSMDFDRQGALLASAGADKTIKLWDIRTGSEALALPAGDAAAASVSFGPEGKLLASAGGGHVKLWDLSTGKALHSLSTPADRVRFRPDGSLIGTSKSGTTLWDPQTGKELRPVLGSTRFAYSYALSPDGRTLALGCLDKTVKVCDLSAPGDQWNVPVRLLIDRHLADLTSSGSSDQIPSFAEFYGEIMRLGRLVPREKLHSLARDNPRYFALAGREMLRECIHFPVVRGAGLSLAKLLAGVCGEVHGDKRLTEAVKRIEAMGGAEIQLSRGLTFLAATHAFVSGSDEQVEAVVKAAPEYASLFVAECVIREWLRGARVLPPEAPKPFQELYSDDVDAIALATRVAGLYERHHGDSWLMTAAKMGERPVVEGDVDFLRAGVATVVAATKKASAFTAADMVELRGFVRRSLRRGYYESALVRAASNLKIAERFGDASAKHIALLDEANVHRRIGGHGKALELIALAEKIATECQDQTLQHPVLAAKARVCQSQGQRDEAMKLIEQAVALAQEVEDARAECRHRAVLALALIAKGALEDAQEEAQRVQNMAKAEQMPEEELAGLYALARCHIGRGEYEQAIQYAKTALTKEDSLGIVAWGWECSFTIGQCHDRLASQEDLPASRKTQHLWQASRFCEKALAAVEAQRGALAHEEQKAFFSESKAALYQSLIMISLRRDQHAEAARFAERCKSAAFFDRFGPKTLSRQKVRLEQRKRDLTQISEALEAKKPVPSRLRKLADRVAQISPKVSALALGVPKALKACERALRVLDRRDWAKAKNPYNLVVRTLKPKSAVLEYYVGERVACVFLLSRGGVKARELESGPDEIARAIDAFRTSAVESLDGNKLSSQSYREPLAQLYQALIAPFEAELAEAEMVYIVPHGLLHYLPFQALIDSEGTYLIEKVSLAYAPSINVLRHCREANQGNKDSLLAVANPKTDWDPLPATEREAVAVSSMFEEKQVVLGAAATEKFVKERAPLFDVLTFPTHGEMCEDDPTKSNLRLTPSDGEDGQWTVAEVFETDLKANLVALSACETGLAGGYAGKLPQADDFVGLTRAFMYAGVPSVVGSLWKVADDSAVALMTAFFANWKQKGMDKAEALRQAQLAMINGDLELGMVVRGPGGVAQVDSTKIEAESDVSLGRHPYFWAPFVLIGDYK